MASYDPDEEGSADESEAQERQVFSYDDIEELRDGNLGIGTFGVVRKIRIKSSNKIAAIKELREDGAREEFSREARNMLEIRGTHENILMLIGIVGEEHAVLGLILPYMPLGSLDKFFPNLTKCFEKKTTKCTDSEWWTLKAFWIRGIARGMRFLHGLEKKMFHCDLKPGNVLLSENTLGAKVSDFGLSKSKEKYSSQSDGSTSSPTGGTTKYIAPEYLENERKAVCTKLDVYSFAITMFFILSEHRAFEGLTTLRIAESVKKGLRPNVEQIYKPYSMKKTVDYLISLMRNCWHEKPQKRPEFEKIADDIQTNCTHLLKEDVIEKLPEIFLTESFRKQIREGWVSQDYSVGSASKEAKSTAERRQYERRVSSASERLRLSTSETLETTYEDLKDNNIWYDDCMVLTQSCNYVRGLAKTKNILFATHNEDCHLYVYHEKQRRVGKIKVKELESPAFWGNLALISSHGNTSRLAVVGQDVKLTYGTLHILEVSTETAKWEASIVAGEVLSYRPNSVTADTDTGNIYITGKDHKIHEVNQSAQEVSSMEIPALAKEPKYSLRLYDGLTIVADYGGSKIVWLDDDGAVKHTYGSLDGECEVNMPRVLALYKNNILVGDKHGVTEFSAGGEYVKRILLFESSVKQPRCLVIEGDMLYIGYRKEEHTTSVPQVKIVNLSNF